MVRQIGANFHNDGNEGRASDVEPKLIALNAQAGVTCLDERIPKKGRNATKRVAPTAPARQVINTNVGIIVENVRLSVWGDASAKHDGQDRAILKRIVFDAEKRVAVGNRDAGQTATALESTFADIGDGNNYAGETSTGESKISNADHVCGNRDAGQVSAILERIVSDAGHCQTVDGGWNGQRATRPGIASDRERIVSICGAIELPLHNCRGRQEKEPKK